MKKKLGKTLLIAFSAACLLSATATNPISYATSFTKTIPKSAVDLRFPGKVSPDAKREKTVYFTANTQLSDYNYLNACSPEKWQSTGLYAAPGETIRIIMPDDVQGLYVQIGSHRDELEDIKPSDRLRAPKITVQQLLVKGENTVSNPYGGLIYINPSQLSESTPQTTLVIKNAIKAPVYTLGETTAKSWAQMANNPKVPMAELIGKKVILTVPSTYIKAVKDPEALMKAWDEMATLEDQLAGLTEATGPNKPTQEPWRFVADVQISWGYMYAGYPIMLYDDACIKDLLSVEGLQKNGWGFYHELGHNHQQDKWTAEPLIEVTCNIFSLYLQEHYGMKSELFADNADTGQSSFKDALAFVKSDRKDKNYADETQAQVFTRLVLFWQLKEAYGWDLYPRLFTAMRALPADTVTETDQDKMDLMVIQLCKLTGDDLTPFFNHWGVSISADAKKALAKLNLKPLTKEIWLVTPPENQ